MKKEVVLAIIIGFTIGLIITLGIYTAQKAIKDRQAGPSPSPSPQAQGSPTPSRSLTITSPQSDSLLDQNSVNITGVTTPGSIVTILTEKEEIIVYPDDSGKFNQPIKLIAGANEINIISLTSQGEQTTATLNLVYSTASIEL